MKLKSIQEQSEFLIVEGLKVYKATIGGNEYWAVQTPENAECEKLGENRTFGDTLHKTKETAINDAKITAKQFKANFERLQLQKEEREAKKREEERIKADTINGFLLGKTPLQAGKIRKNLNTLVNFRGLIKTIREYIEEWNGATGLTIRKLEEPKYKNLPDTYGLSSIQIMVIKEKAAQTKTVYLVNEIELGKTAYEYAKHLINLKG